MKEKISLVLWFIMCLGGLYISGSWAVICISMLITGEWRIQSAFTYTEVIIIAVVSGIVALLSLFGIIYTFCRRSRKKKVQDGKQDSKRNGKKMKTAVVFLVMAISLTLISVSFVGCAGGKGNNNGNPTFNINSVGVWWWDKALCDNDEYLEFVKGNGVSEIYLCDTRFNEKTNAFIEKAHAKDIRVYLLVGEWQWCVNGKGGFDDMMSKYVSFATFDGLHLDVEPHQNPAFGETVNGDNIILQQYIDFVTAVITQYPDIKIDFDIPFWFDNYTVLVNGGERPLHEVVIDSATRVFIMSYRDTAEKIIDISKEELSYAKSKNKQIFLGVECYSNEGDQVSFVEEGKQVMYAEINKLKDLIPYQKYGVAIHQVARWFDLAQ
jgi:heme/copper-type cytochrome/quinol oxidase subunit 4